MTSIFTNPVLTSQVCVILEKLILGEVSFWKRLSCSLAHSTLIIEGAMHIHTFLVDCRNERSKIYESTIDSEEESHTERIIFEEDCRDSGM